MIAPMLDRIRKYLTAEERSPPDELEIAVAVLLIDAARMDGVFDRHERATIERLLARRFELTRDDTEELLSLAEETAWRSQQLQPFTLLAVEHMEPQRRVRLIEMLWDVAYADEKLDPHEDELLHRIAGMIDVTDEEREAAKHRVLRWLQQKHNR